MVDKRVVVYFKQVTVKGNESVLISKSFFVNKCISKHLSIMKKSRSLICWACAASVTQKH